MSETQLAVSPPQELRTVESEPGDLLRLAVDRGMGPDALEKLMALQERMAAAKAKAEYREAFARFQKLQPAIPKSKKGFNYVYAPLEVIADAIRSTLSECGLTYTFDAEFNDSHVTVTCYVHHIGGHSESARFTGKIDGAKVLSNTGKAVTNDVQTAGSAMSYGKRYALCAALGLSVGGEDNDAYAEPEQQAAPTDPAIVAKIKSIGTSKSLADYWRELTPGQRGAHVRVFQSHAAEVKAAEAEESNA
jgi:hypothetical protein